MGAINSMSSKFVLPLLTGLVLAGACVEATPVDDLPAGGAGAEGDATGGAAFGGGGAPSSVNGAVVGEGGASGAAGSGGGAPAGAPGTALDTAGAAGQGGAGATVFSVGPSCDGLPATCGPTGSASCCAASLVLGGTFNRSNDELYPATVSDFGLDNYEISVGRFRKFVAAYSQSMIPAGAGKNPNNPADEGWQVAWNTNLPADAATLLEGLESHPWQLTWTHAPGAQENLPINDLHWYEVYAFCVWDGGRLPTEAEWNYAAAGGAEQREYPWSKPPKSGVIDAAHAVFPGIAGTDLLAPVGSRSPQGDGKWGQSDLLGSLREWTADGFREYGNPCHDCSAPNGSIGGWAIRPAQGAQAAPATRDSYSGVPYAVGARCARAAL
jgi:formylglycine-generating enzyme